MLSQDALKILFTVARSQNGWLDKPVSDEQIKQIYNLMKFCPTSANCCPLRLTFLKGMAAKLRLKPHLSEGNIQKSMTAPAVAIMAYDPKFYELLPQLFPHTDAKSWFVGKPEKIKQAANLNASLQIGYFILATRAMGLDCGPMGGFDALGLDKEFFSDGQQKSILVCGIGYGDESKILARSPRLNFEQTCQIL